MSCRFESDVFFVCVVVVSLFAAVIANPRSCDLIKKDVELRGFEGNFVLDKPQNGLVCGEGSCCNEKLENNMLSYSQKHIEKYVKDAVGKVATLVETRAKKFDEIFRDMMNNSKQEFHDMFERTYGKIYLQNSDVFADFFNELETYYKKGTVRLSETMDTFFGILYQRMFMVINAQYNLDDNYMQCVNNHMLEMKPFGDSPHKLTVTLKRSFVATRMLYKSLSRAGEVVREMSTMRLSEECSQQLVHMQLCGVCRGEMGNGACSRYCSDTITLCLKHHIQLSDSWDTFVDAVDKVAERLVGPYNVDSVVGSLNIKISEAIMNFQEIGAEVSQKIQTRCGTLGLKRPKRTAGYESPPEENPNMEIRYQTIKMHGKKKHKKVQENVDQTPTLDKLIEDIKLKIKNTKQFWVQLPYQYCNNETISASPSDDGKCWNGTNVGFYENPMPKLEPTETPMISEQVYVLNGLTDKLKKAFHGEDVEIIDDTEETFDGSGSGSGDGDDDNEEEEEQERNNGHVDEEEANVNRIDDTFESSPPLSSTATPEVVRTSGGHANKMSLARALVQLLLPMVLAWFGGAIRDLL
ncbi:glypican-6 [Anthonomus grandis grandis]|uniref:glypican-6 n=1 Tax=Anthonomus grandis grandis TaxID=2921223 RepID=UPI00216634CC|nr:glypican-6 [Anthonomus grandis grandis]